MPSASRNVVSRLAVLAQTLGVGLISRRGTRGLIPSQGSVCGPSQTSGLLEDGDCFYIGERWLVRGVLHLEAPWPWCSDARAGVRRRFPSRLRRPIRCHLLTFRPMGACVWTLSVRPHASS